MRKLIVSEFVSLNGVIEAPGGEASHPHAGWTFDAPGDDHYPFKQDEIEEAAALLLGRVTYEGFSSAWPQRDGPFADKINAMPKYVVSSTLTDPAWNNTTVLSGDPAAEVEKLKAGDGGPILVNGSAQLVHTLVEYDLVDTYRAMIHPILIADGLRMFPDPSEKRPLELGDVVSYDSGVVLITYYRAGD